MLDYHNYPCMGLNYYNPFRPTSIFEDLSNEFDNLFYYQRKQRELGRQREQQLLKKLRKPSQLRQVETEHSYQLQLFKQYGDFNNYEIRVIKRLGNFYLIVSCDDDNFEKTYYLDNNINDINKIDWQWFRSDNVLVIHIPKKSNTSSHVPKVSKEEMKRLKHKKQIDKSHKKQHKHDKLLRLKTMKELEKQHELQLKHESKEEHESENSSNKEKLSIDEQQSDSEYVTPNESELETPSESESEPIVSPPINNQKKQRSPSIEEVEDDEFVLYRKRLNEKMH